MQVINSIAKNVVTTIVSEIPFVGGLLSGIIGLFWPGGAASIWDQVTVLKYIHRHVLRYEWHSITNV